MFFLNKLLQKQREWNDSAADERGLCFYSQLTAIVVHASLFNHGHLEMEQKADGA